MRPPIFRKETQASDFPSFVCRKEKRRLFFSWVKGGVRGGLNLFSFAIKTPKALEKLTGESLYHFYSINVVNLKTHSFCLLGLDFKIQT
ncbi:hypothetical protein BJI48_05715 [Helicobacter sp. 11S02596-1]|nr:hypothetical protein BJI48_05715 [Helicobacter sp. 11S02596-1]